MPKQAHKDIVSLAAEYCRKLLTSKLPGDLWFHDFYHTLEVVEATQILASKCGLSPGETEIVLLAAWFHDTGYSVSAESHEQVSSDLANYFLLKKNYPPQKLEQVLESILATRLPQQPNNLVQQVVCDADLYHLSRPSYWKRNKKLRRELESRLKESWSDLSWFRKNLNFLEKHHYFTPYGKTELTRLKRINLLVNRRLVQQLESGSHDHPIFGWIYSLS